MAQGQQGVRICSLGEHGGIFRGSGAYGVPRRAREDEPKKKFDFRIFFSKIGEKHHFWPFFRENPKCRKMFFGSKKMFWIFL